MATRLTKTFKLLDFPVSVRVGQRELRRSTQEVHPSPTTDLEALEMASAITRTILRELTPVLMGEIETQLRAEL